MTKNEIMKELKNLGIKFDITMKKSELEALLEKGAKPVEEAPKQTSIESAESELTGLIDLALDVLNGLRKGNRHKANRYNQGTKYLNEIKRICSLK